MRYGGDFTLWFPRVLLTLWRQINFETFHVNSLSIRFCAISWLEILIKVPHEGKLDHSASTYQNVTYPEPWIPLAGGLVWVGLRRDSAPAKSLSPWGEGRGKKQRRKLLLLVCFGCLTICFGRLTTNNLKLCLFRLICLFVIAKNPKNKSWVVYDPIRCQRVNEY